MKIPVFVPDRPQSGTIRIAAFITLFGALTAPQSFGQANDEALSWGFSFQTRYESRKDFNFLDSSQDFQLSRTRFNLNWRQSDLNSFFLELQDARIAGEDGTGVPTINEKLKGTVFADELDIHQAFWERTFENGRLRVGRQKLNLGDNRLVSSLEWVNTARVNDGVRFTWTPGNRQVDLFATTVVAVDPDNFNDHAPVGNRYFDSDLHGIYVNDPASMADWDLYYWYFLRNNSRAGDQVGTLGLRLLRQDWRWRPEFQFAWQHGEFSDRDHSAWMMHIGVRRSIGGGQLKFVYNFGTGDSQPTDDKHETFDNLYGLNHPYYGYMDLFSLQNQRNFEVSYRRQLTQSTSFYVSFNDFRLAESTDAWYNAGLTPIRIASDGADRHVGQEIDVQIRSSLFNGRITVDAGLSTLRGGSYLDAFGLDGSASFFYASLLYGLSQ